ncbi:hypothetical protein BP00DRAFT_225318 [Aspergillus indologenus CBS 114.80]|uniref:Uncharacterized protein n=1 Tax=Aspergillus indologenus CBS 114.80 TaxID=1450541 RepID=A0A2V5HZ83_9EURO|nr:hypothetical protein BP00DRAFT_225318 [Aspergillus indologenus CBS 114.80]
MVIQRLIQDQALQTAGLNDPRVEPRRLELWPRQQRHGNLSVPGIREEVITLKVVQRVHELWVLVIVEPQIQGEPAVDQRQGELHVPKHQGDFDRRFARCCHDHRVQYLRQGGNNGRDQPGHQITLEQLMRDGLIAGVGAVMVRLSKQVDVVRHPTQVGQGPGPGVCGVACPFGEKQAHHRVPRRCPDPIAQRLPELFVAELRAHREVQRRVAIDPRSGEDVGPALQQQPGHGDLGVEGGDVQQRSGTEVVEIPTAPPGPMLVGDDHRVVGHLRRNHRFPAARDHLLLDQVAECFAGAPEREERVCVCVQDDLHGDLWGERCQPGVELLEPLQQLISEASAVVSFEKLEDLLTFSGHRGLWVSAGVVEWCWAFMTARRRCGPLEAFI